MKKLVENYTFDPATNTVTFTDYSTIDLERVLIINDTTRGTVIFNFACPGMTGSVSTNILTLSYDVSGFAATDKLLIYYEDGIQESTVVDLIETMRYLIKSLAVIGNAQGVAADIRVTPVSVPTVASVTTLTNFQQVNGIASSFLLTLLQDISAINSNINNVAR